MSFLIDDQVGPTNNREKTGEFSNWVQKSLNSAENPQIPLGSKK